MAVSDEVRPARRARRGRGAAGATDTATLDAIANRILWLAVRMIHEANHVRPSTDGIKVGGHQASSASVVSILTALYFRWLRAGDLVAIKPHASPAYHSLQYLLGNLDASMLTRLREFGGLQSYPSRTKDPDPVDFSTGSVGLGAVAPMFAALADRYLRLHFRESIASQPERRFVALVGDAELDEGNVWEAILEEGLGELGNVTMIVDLNRQSLDRVVPGIRIRRVEGMFAAAGWHAIEAKYGPPAPGAVRAPRRRGASRAHRRHGERGLPDPHPPARSRSCASACSRAPPRPVATTSPGTSRDVPDDDLPALIGDLGGHDQVELERAFRAADAETHAADRDLRLHDQGLAAAVRRRQPEPLGASRAPTRSSSSGATSGSTPTTSWAGFAPGSPEGQLATRRRAELGYDDAARPDRADPGARDRDARHPDRGRDVSTQQAFGDTLAALARDPEIGGRHRDRRARRRRLHQPRRLDQPRRRLLGRGRRPTATTSSGRWSGSRVRPGATSSSASAR